MEYGCCSPPIERINDRVNKLLSERWTVFIQKYQTQKKYDTTFFSVYIFTVAEQLTKLDDNFLESLEISKNFSKTK